jgi:hypothetical protein
MHHTYRYPPGRDTTILYLNAVLVNTNPERKYESKTYLARSSEET